MVPIYYCNRYKVGIFNKNVDQYASENETNIHTHALGLVFGIIRNY